MPAVFNQSSGISLGEGRNRGRAAPPDIQLSSIAVSSLWGCTCMLLCCWRTDSTAGRGVQTNSQHTGPSLAPQHPPPLQPRPPLHTLSPHIILNFCTGFCISSKTQLWIFTPTKLGGVGGDLMPAFGWWWREEVAGMQYAAVQRTLWCSHSAPPCCRGNFTTRGEDEVAPLPHQTQELGQLSAHSENTWHVSAVTHTAMLSPPHEPPSPQGLCRNSV